MKNRLQFNRHFTVFSGETITQGGEQVWISGREQAKNWLEDRIGQDDFIPLIGEPIVLRYLDDAGNKQLILAVGKSTGNPREYHSIDTAELNEGIEGATTIADAALQLASGVTKDVANYRVILHNMIGDNGVELEDGNYFDTDDPTGCGLYKVYPGTNFISAATSLAKADYILDTELGKTNEMVEELSGASSGVEAQLHELSSATIALSDKVDTFSAATVSEFNRVDNDIDALSSATVSFSGASDTLFNNIKGGAGLKPDGTYEINATANYIDAAHSLNEADVILDSTLNQLSGNTNAAINNLSAGTMQLSADTAAAIAQLSGATGEGLQALSAAINNIKGGAGLNPDGTYKVNATANYINVANSLNDADVKLDTAVKELSSNTISAVNQLSGNTKAAIDALSAGTVNDINNLSSNTVSAINTLSANTVSAINQVAADANSKINELSAGTIAADQALEEKINALSATTVTGQDAIKVTSGGNKVVSLLISEQDNVLTQDVYGLKANVTLTYDSDTKKINLNGKNNALISQIDATNFIKDGMLDTAFVKVADASDKEIDPAVIIGKTYIVLVFNTDSGKERVYVSAEDLVNIYTVSGSSTDYLVIEGYQIGAKVNVDGGLAGYDYTKHISAVTNNIIESAGLLNSEGGYPSHTGTEYITDATSLNDADVKLDIALQEANAKIEALSGGSYTEIAALSGSVVNNTNNINNLSGSVVENKTDIQNLSGSVVTNKANIEILSGKTNDLEENVKKIAVTNVTISQTGNAVVDAIYQNSALTLVKGNMQEVISDLETIRNNAQSGATAYVNVNNLSGVVQSLSSNTTNVINNLSGVVQSFSANTVGEITDIRNIIGNLSGGSAGAIQELSASVVTNKTNINNLSGATVSEFSSAFTAINQLSADTKAAIDNAIEGLDSSTAVTAGKYITGIIIANGKISGITEEVLPTPVDLSAATIELSASVVTNKNNIIALSASVVTNQNNITALSAATTGISQNLNQLSASVVTNQSNISSAFTAINNLSADTKNAIAQLSAGTIQLSADTVGYVNSKTNGVLTVKRGNTELGKYSASANSTINVDVTGADVLLTGYQVGSATPITATDTVNSAFGKTQAQINANNSTITDIRTMLEELSGASIGDLTQLITKVNTISGDVISLSAETVSIADTMVKDIKYDSSSSAHTIYLVDGSNRQIGSGFSADAFIKDGMLDNVAIVTIGGEQYIEFTFNSDAGKQKIDIKVSDFAALYNAGNGIDISSANTISIKLASGNDSNYLKLDGSGLYLTGISTITGNVSSLSASVVNNSTNISNLSGSVVTNKTDISNLSGSVVDNKTNINNLSGSVVDNASAITILSGILIDDELVISAAFNDLNDKVQELSANTGAVDLANLSAATINLSAVTTAMSQDVKKIAVTAVTINGTGNNVAGASYSNSALTFTLNNSSPAGLSGVEMNGSQVTVTDNVAILGTVITAQTQLSTATTDTGNVITSLSVNDHQITYVKGFSAASSADLVALSAATTGINESVKNIAVTAVTVSGTGNALVAATYSNSALTIGKGNVQEVISDLATIRNGANSGASAWTSVTELSASVVTNKSNIEAISGRTYKYYTATTSTALDLSKYLTILTLSANATLTIGTLPTMVAGTVEEAHVIISNTGSSLIEVTVPSGANVVLTGGNKIYIAAGERGELNAMITYDGANYTIYIITT